MQLGNDAKASFPNWAERPMLKRNKVLFGEQAPGQYFISFQRMAKQKTYCKSVITMVKYSQWEMIKK